MPTGSMILSVIIVTWNSETVIAECLDWLYKTIRETPFETIIVDNHSTDGTRRLIQEKYPMVKLIQSPENFGFAKGNNLGFTYSTGEYVLLLNPDAFLNYGSPEILLPYMASHSDVGVIGAQQRQKDGSEAYSYGCTKLGSILADDLNFLRRFYYRRKPRWVKDSGNLGLGRVGYATGSFMLIPSKLIKKIGLFDEHFFAYYEEREFCHRVHKNGYKVLFAHNFSVTHLEGVSFKQRSVERDEILGRSKLYYIEKCFGKRMRDFSVIILTIYMTIKIMHYKAISMIFLKRDNKSLSKYKDKLELLKKTNV